MGGVSMETYKLSDLCEILDSKRKPLSALQRAKKQGIYPYYGAQGIIDHLDEYLLDGEYLLVAEDGANLETRNQPIANIANGKIWVNNHAHVLGNNGKCPLNLLGFILNNMNISPYVTGCAQPKLNQENLRNIEIELPSHIDRIASILSSLDRKIELNNKINADLEEMAQAIFKNWFVDFEPFKDGKFVNSELGMIPEGWKVGRLTDVIKLMPGGTPKTSEPLYWDNGTIPFFSPKDVNGVYCFTTEKHITETGLNKCSSNLYPKDTIFITCRGTVGKVCLAACDMAMNQSNYAIKAIDGYSQCYVFFLVKSVVERLIKKSNGAVFSAITSKDFDEEILIPSQKAVEDFTNVIDGFFRRIFTIGTENSRLSLLRDTLLPRLMSGELEVPE